MMRATRAVLDKFPMRTAQRVHSAQSRRTHTKVARRVQIVARLVWTAVVVC